MLFNKIEKKTTYYNLIGRVHIRSEFENWVREGLILIWKCVHKKYLHNNFDRNQYLHKRITTKSS